MHQRKNAPLHVQHDSHNRRGHGRIIVQLLPPGTAADLGSRLVPLQHCEFRGPRADRKEELAGYAFRAEDENWAIFVLYGDGVGAVEVAAAVGAEKVDEKVKFLCQGDPTR